MLDIADIEGCLLFPLTQLFDSSVLPCDIVDLDRGANDFLNSVYFTDSSLQPVENGVIGTLILVIKEELLFSPFGDAVELVVGSGGLCAFEACVRLEMRPGGFRFEISLNDISVGLRVSPNILCPLKLGTNEPADGSLDIPLGSVSISFGTDQPIAITWSGNPSLPRCMIGNSGVIVSSGIIQWLTPVSENLPDNIPQEFVGLYIDNLAIELSRLDLDNAPIFFLDYAFIGRGGFSGSINLKNLSLTGSLAEFTFELTEFNLTLVQNSITASSVKGLLTLPFFNIPLEVAIGFSLDGSFTISVAGNGILTWIFHKKVV